MAKKRKGVYARDIDKLNVIFAITALASLLSVGWMAYDDFARPWKQYQRRFRVVQGEVAQQQLQDAEGQVDQQALAQLTQQRDAAEQTLQGNSDRIEQLDSELAALGKQMEMADQNFRFARSNYDALRWEFEETRQEHGEEGATGERAAMEAADAEIARTAARVEALTLEQQALEGERDQLRNDVTVASSEITTTNSEIDRLRDRLDTLRFDWVYYLRNAPMMDAFNPSVRINQAVLANIEMDLNFASAPRVDRCETCHLGARSSDYESYEQPYTSHPRLELFAADDSIHPSDDFGCTVCHLGKGHATSFESAVHTPDNESEAKRWHDELGWEHIELWEWPMRPGREIEASCLSCHASDAWIPDAPKLEYGLGLIDKLGCNGCHQIDRWDDARKTGPSLMNVAVKTTPEWAFNWVTDPKSFRPETPMPTFFDLANTSDENWTRRNPMEIDAIVAYLWASSGGASEMPLDPAPSGVAARGEELVNNVGCLGCHTIGEFEQPEEPGIDDARFASPRQHGPNLSGLGSKVNADWLFTWIRNPSHYWDETVMPNLRLTSQEGADITAYLMAQTREGWDSPTIPQVDASVRDEVVLEYLRRQLPSEQAQTQVDAMDTEAKRVYLGEQLISRYGCFGCHLIPGFESAGRIGTSLSEWGSKAVAQLDFGLTGLPHERRAFLEQKLRSPRSYDVSRVRNSQDLLRMPNFQLQEHEIEAIAGAILGFTDDEIPDAAKPAATPDRIAIEAGRKIVEKYNCRGCHIVEDQGGAIRDVIADVKMAGDPGLSRPAALTFSPPNLRSEGARVQPAWLYGFFKEPSTVRPWLDVRMPTFAFDDAQLNALTQYFAAVDGVPYPFEETFTGSHSYPANLVAEGGQLAADQPGRLQCFSCHFQGAQQPRVAQAQWAPDLALAADRLRPDWINGWIKDPQSLQPGTNMPQFYSNLEPGRGYWPALNNNPETEISALVAYIMSIGK